MILIVDDDPIALSLLAETLRQAGHEVTAKESAAAALAFLEGNEPELVISDVVMPEMSGLDLKVAYAERLPGRPTPFIFLSSLADQADVVRGLDAGADDYLTKPFAPPLLLAKVRAHLRRAREKSTPVFVGDLAKLPFLKVLQFCETHGLTGEVEVKTPSVSSTVEFKAGALVDDSAAGTELIDKLFLENDGLFVIRSRPVEFRALLAAAPTPSTPAASPHEERLRPMGRLSGVRAGKRLLQLQTELVTTPTPQLVTVVILDGKTVLKRMGRAPTLDDKAAVERAIALQHGQVEVEVREKLATLTPRSQSSSTKDRLETLLDDGLSAFLAHEYDRALASWMEAQELNPGNKSLAVNLGVVRRRLGRP